MKRWIISFLALTLMLPALAQNLTGTWTISESMNEKQEDMDSSMEMTSDMVLQEGGVYSQSGKASMTIGSGEDSFYFTILFSAKGTWKKEGNTLTIQNNPKEAKVDVGECNLPGFLKVLIVNTMKKELKKELGSRKPDVYAIVSLTDQELVLLETGVKNAQPETYKRK